jgi:WD40 repeat protein
VLPATIYSPDGKLLACRGPKGLHVWEVAGGRELRQLAVPEDNTLTRAVFTRDNRSLALDADDGTVVLWELATGQPRRRLGVPARGVDDGPAANGRNNTTLSFALLLFLPAGSTTLVLSPDGQTLAHGRRDGVHLWDVATGKERVHFKGHRG